MYAYIFKMEEEKYLCSMARILEAGNSDYRWWDQLDLKKYIEVEQSVFTDGKKAGITETMKKEKNPKQYCLYAEQLEYIRDESTVKEVFDTSRSVFERKPYALGPSEL